MTSLHTSCLRCAIALIVAASALAGRLCAQPPALEPLPYGSQPWGVIRADSTDVTGRSDRVIARYTTEEEARKETMRLIEKEEPAETRHLYGYRKQPYESFCVAEKTFVGTIDRHHVFVSFQEGGVLAISGELQGSGRWEQLKSALWLDTAVATYRGQVAGENLSGQRFAKEGSEPVTTWNLFLVQPDSGLRPWVVIRAGRSDVSGEEDKIVHEFATREEAQAEAVRLNEVKPREAGVLYAFRERWPGAAQILQVSGKVFQGRIDRDNVSVSFSEGGALSISGETAEHGKWTQAGANLWLETKEATFRGRIAGDILSGLKFVNDGSKPVTSWNLLLAQPDTGLKPWVVVRPDIRDFTGRSDEVVSCWWTRDEAQAEAVRLTKSGTVHAFRERSPGAAQLLQVAGKVFQGSIDGHKVSLSFAAGGGFSLAGEIQGDGKWTQRGPVLSLETAASVFDGHAVGEELIGRWLRKDCSEPVCYSSLLLVHPETPDTGSKPWVVVRPDVDDFTGQSDLIVADCWTQDEAQAEAVRLTKTGTLHNFREREPGAGQIVPVAGKLFEGRIDGHKVSIRFSAGGGFSMSGELQGDGQWTQRGPGLALETPVSILQGQAVGEKLIGRWLRKDASEPVSDCVLLLVSPETGSRPWLVVRPKIEDFTGQGDVLVSEWWTQDEAQAEAVRLTKTGTLHNFREREPGAGQIVQVAGKVFQGSIEGQKVSLSFAPGGKFSISGEIKGDGQWTQRGPLLALETAAVTFRGQALGEKLIGRGLWKDASQPASRWSLLLVQPDTGSQPWVVIRAGRADFSGREDKIVREFANREDAQAEAIRLSAAESPETGVLYAYRERAPGAGQMLQVAGSVFQGSIGPYNVAVSFSARGELSVSGDMEGVGSWEQAGATLLLQTRVATFRGQIAGDTLSGLRFASDGSEPVTPWTLLLVQPDTGSQPWLVKLASTRDPAGKTDTTVAAYATREEAQRTAARLNQVAAPGKGQIYACRSRQPGAASVAGKSFHGRIDRYHVAVSFAADGKFSVSGEMQGLGQWTQAGSDLQLETGGATYRGRIAGDELSGLRFVKDGSEPAARWSLEPDSGRSADRLGRWVQTTRSTESVHTVTLQLNPDHTGIWLHDFDYITSGGGMVQSRLLRTEVKWRFETEPDVSLPRDGILLEYVRGEQAWSKKWIALEGDGLALPWHKAGAAVALDTPAVAATPAPVLSDLKCPASH